MNLATLDFQKSVIFKTFPAPTEILYHGLGGEKMMHFSVTDQAGIQQTFWVKTIMRKDESTLWESCQELILRSLKNAETRLRGIYSFDLLAVEMFEGLDIFQWGELTQMILNHSRKLSPGQLSLVRYCSVFGLLSKRVDVEWGKINLETPVRILDRTPQQMDLLFKRMLLAAEFNAQSNILLLDLSREPLWREDDDEQQSRFKKMLEKVQPTLRNPVDIYLVDKHGRKNLFINAISKPIG